MDHSDHVNLIRRGVEDGGPRWADLGAGSGAFTLALADILGPGAQVVAIDRDRSALQRNAAAMASQFPDVGVEHRVADFATQLDLPLFDGVVMGNSLHFQRDQLAVVKIVAGYLRPGGRMVVVEYNIVSGNSAVPHPVPYRRWEELANGVGLAHTELIARRPSRWLREIYSAVSW